MRARAKRLPSLPIEQEAKDELSYGAVVVTKGPFKGRIMYYDDSEHRTAFCYAGHPLHFVGS